MPTPRHALSLLAVVAFAALAAGSGDGPKNGGATQVVDPAQKSARETQAAETFNRVKKDDIKNLPEAQRDSVIMLVLQYGKDGAPGMAEWKAEGRRVRAADQARRAQAGQRAVAQLKKEHDEFQHVTWYKDRSFPEYANSNAFQAYIGKSDQGGDPYLRMLLRYSGDDWLFVQTFEVLADGQQFTVDPGGHFKVERDNGEGDVWEWYDANVTDADMRMLRAVAGSNTAKLRYNGQQYRQDRTITSSEKAALRRVLSAYEALQGPARVASSE